MGTGPAPSVTEHGLYPAEHRALRELHATARQLARHWDRLAGRLGGDAAALLREGATIARSLLAELEPRAAKHSVQGRPAAQGVGINLAGLRNRAGDLVLERNQALRLAVLDVQHVTTLVAYLCALAEQRGDAELAAFLGGWVERLRVLEERARATAVACAGDPEQAVLPAEDSRLGRAGHRFANALGTAGEAIDGSPLGRFARRRG